MRALVGISAVFFLATLGHVSAAESQSEAPSATAPQPAQDASPAQAAPTPPDLQPGVKTPTPAPAATVKKPDKAGLTVGEKNLLRQGYRLEVRNGEKYFCRNEDTLGSRLHEHKVCGTEETIAHRAEANNDNVRDSLKKSGLNRGDGK